LVLDKKEEVRVSIPPQNGKLLSYLHKYATVLDRGMVDGKISVLVRIERRYMKPLAEYVEPASSRMGNNS